VVIALAVTIQERDRQTPSQPASCRRTAQTELMHNRTELRKSDAGTTNDLRHGTQFGVLMREELVTLCVGMRGDADQVK